MLFKPHFKLLTLMSRMCVALSTHIKDRYALSDNSPMYYLFVRSGNKNQEITTHRNL